MLLGRGQASRNFCQVRWNSIRWWSQHRVSEESNLQLDSFENNFFSKAPVVLKQEFARVPAVSKWNVQDFSHLRKFGSKLIPIEISSNKSTYASEPGETGNFEQAEVPLQMFLDLLLKLDAEATHDNPGSLKVYLAQHALFDSIPELYPDVCLPNFELPRGGKNKIPHFALVGKADLYNINVWIGHTTHTPLHHDPYHNIFAQLFNTKRVMIFPPEMKPELSFHTDHLKKNTSAISDIFDAGNFDKLPKAVQEQAQYAEIAQGDGLYIPQGWLHSFRGSQGISGSVNWWFR